jgi:enterochelin esterase-like enzyme
MKRFATLCAGLLPALFPAGVLAQPVHPESLEQGFVIVVDDVARMATKDRPMFLASNYGGWDPAKPEYELTPRSDGRWQFVFDEKPDRSGTLQFKFTLGSWDYVETDPDGNDIDNRTLPKVDPAALSPGEKPVFEFRVPKFRSPADVASARQSTQYRDLDVTGTVRRLQVAGGAGEASGSMRDLLVWLPPSYDDHPERTYPVLYLFDAQNLFEEEATPWGDWGADETATRLIAEGAIRELIIVGVPHAGAARSQEYLPFDDGRGAEPHGEAFGRWFIGEVAPRVERAFRVSSRREETAVGGSSYGSVISLHLATHYPEKIGAALLESFPPARQGSGAAAYFDAIEAWPERVFIGVGDQEFGGGPDNADRNAGYVQWNQSLRDRMLASGLEEEAVRLVVTPGARHNEQAWRDRLPEALGFLFPAQ